MAITATIGNKTLGNNGDDPIVMYKVGTGQENAAFAAMKGNDFSEVAFKTEGGDMYVIQSESLNMGLFSGMPKVGAAIKVGALSGTVVATNHEMSMFKTGLITGAAGGLLALLGVVGLPAAGILGDVGRAAPDAMVKMQAILGAGMLGLGSGIGMGIVGSKRTSQNTIPQLASEKTTLAPF